ncbi:MAG: hypothetical protein LUE93_07605 [Bacteroides sp.]|nr:hypothetical protein [Bacteroides sp.]
MSCCHNKKYVENPCVKDKEWNEVNNLLGVTECGTTIKIKKPLYELDKTDRNKLDTLTTEGKGNKVLTDNGKYKTVEALKAVVNGNNPKDVEINTPSGEISINAREGIKLSAGKGQSVKVEEMEITREDVTFKGEPLVKASDIKNAVRYDRENHIRPHGNVILKNSAAVSGRTTDENTFKMLSMTSGDKMEVGSLNIETTL